MIETFNMFVIFAQYFRPSVLAARLTINYIIELSIYAGDSVR